MTIISIFEKFMRNFKSFLLNFLLLVASISITFALCEYIYRKALFDLSKKAFDKYRQPSLYAADWDENYWKLFHLWCVKEPFRSHPFLGWNFQAWKRSLLHPEVQFLNGKRAVLLYGDSFAQCKDTTVHFEKYLNADSTFTSQFHFINYGTGGHGVDQIYTMFKNTFVHYENPVVIFSFLTSDLYRSVLTFRDGQKPTYEIQSDGSLKLDTSRYIPSNKAYLIKYPPNIHSYLWRKFLFSNANFFPAKFTKMLTGETSNEKKVLELNRKILNDVIRLLRQNKTDFIFLLFETPDDYKLDDNANWKVNFALDFFNKNKIPFIRAKEVLNKEHSLTDSLKIWKYHIINDGHLTSYSNILVGNEMKNRLLEKQYEQFDKGLKKDNYIIPEQRAYYYSDIIDSVKKAIKTDSLILNAVRKISEENKISFELAFDNYAMWLLARKE